MNRMERTSKYTIARYDIAYDFSTALPLYAATHSIACLRYHAGSAGTLSLVSTSLLNIEHVDARCDKALDPRSFGPFGINDFVAK